MSERLHSIRMGVHGCFCLRAGQGCIRCCFPLYGCSIYRSETHSPLFDTGCWMLDKHRPGLGSREWRFDWLHRASCEANGYWDD